MERVERKDGLAERVVNPRCLRDLENGFLPVFAVRAVLALRAVLAVLAVRAVLAVLAVRAVLAVLAVRAVLAVLALRAVLAVLTLAVPKGAGSGLFLNLAGKVIDLVLVDCIPY